MTEAADGTTTRETKVTRQLDLASLGHGPHPNIYGQVGQIRRTMVSFVPHLTPSPAPHLEVPLPLPQVVTGWQVPPRVGRGNGLGEGLRDNGGTEGGWGETGVRCIWVG